MKVEDLAVSLSVRPMTEHKQVKVYCKLDKCDYEVDERIASLLLALWDRGIETDNSCQENRPGIVWIGFRGPEDLKKFLDILIDKVGKDFELLERIICGGDEPDDWKYDICLFDSREYFINEDTIDTDFSAKSDIRILSSVRFPISDFETVLKAIRRRSS